MELGGNAPFIVFDDADVESAAANVVTSGLRNAGQTCICANRVFCQVSPAPAPLPALPALHAAGTRCSVPLSHI